MIAITVSGLALGPAVEPTQAAEGDAGETTRSATMASTQPGGPDFLFGSPSARIGIRWQWIRARADSEIHDFVSDLLTIEPADFNAHGVAVDVGVPLTPRLDAQVGFDASRTGMDSNYREFVDAAGLEIEQSTRLTQVGLTGTLELALLPRGRAIGQYAWIPAAVTPYVGAGVGLHWYRFEQEGDFVDFVDQSIFTARLQSSGWTPGTHLSAGVDVRVTDRVQLTAEVRQQWAAAGMSVDFADFDDIDLSGLRVTGGVQFAF